MGGGGGMCGEVMDEVSHSTVSVIIPTYNRAHLVGRAIQSAFNQTCQDFEVIVVDDGSTDNTGEVVKSFNDPRIHYIRHSENRGVATARNTGIDAAHGEYIAFLDSDDEWLPEKLQHQLDIFREADEEVGLVYSEFVRVYPNGKVKRHREAARGVSVGFTCTWLVKREVFESIEGFDETMPALEDMEISIRIRQKYAVLYDPSVILRYYITEGSACRNVRNIRLATGKLIERYADIVTRDELANWYFMLGKACIMEGEMSKGRASLFRAVSLRPLKMQHYSPFLSALFGYKGYLWLRRLKRVLVRGNFEKLIKNISEP
jgi:glycosyltransferase involved in cell wall biosynthesis